MKHFLFFLISLVSITCFSQKKKISLEEIWSFEFYQEGMEALQSLKDGSSYIVQESDWSKPETRVEIYSYKTGEKTGTLINSAHIKGLPYFQDFKLSTDETKAILGIEVESIFRNSTKGLYFIYDIATKKLLKIEDEKIQEPYFSPDNSKVAYVKDNNLYYLDLTTYTTHQITTDGQKNKIINGITDWVYEEEFSFVKAFEWSSDGSYIAYLKFDETEVPEFSMDIYGTYGTSLYPAQQVFKYPKAGEKNSKVELFIFDLKSKKKFNNKS